MKILKFSASWCNPCKMLSKTLEGMNLPYEVEEVDIEDNTALSNKYQIRGVPTLVLVKDNGDELRRTVGALKADCIGEWLSE